MSSGPGGSALRLWLSCLISLLITFPAFGAEGDLLYAEGLQLLQQGFYQEASRQLERAVRLRPQPDRCFALGVAYFQLHRPTQAYQAYQQALGLLPEPALAARIRSGLGDVYFELEDYPQAVEAYRQALSFQPAWSGVRLKLATSYLRLERFGEALRESESLLASPSPLSEAYYLRSLIYLARHQWEAAIQELERLRAQPEHRFEAYQQLNWLYRLQQRYDQASEVARLAVAEYGQSVPQAYQLAAATGLEQLTFCLPLAGCRPQPAQLRCDLERWLLMSPEQPQGYFELGWLEQLEGNPEAARDAYRRAYSLFPSRSDYLLKLAEMEWTLGQRQSVHQWLADLPAPNSPSLWRELPKWAEAEPELLQRWWRQLRPGVELPRQLLSFWLSYLEALPPPAADAAEAQVLQALRLWQAGQADWARPLLLQARQQEPQWWLPCELLGRIALEQEPAAALPWLEAAYRLNPISRQLALLLAEGLPPGPARRQHLQRALQTFPEEPILQELYLKQLTVNR